MTSIELDLIFDTFLELNSTVAQVILSELVA